MCHLFSNLQKNVLRINSYQGLTEINFYENSSISSRDRNIAETMEIITIRANVGRYKPKPIQYKFNLSSNWNKNFLKFCASVLQNPNNIVV